MAARLGEDELAAGYRKLWNDGRQNQNAQLWDEELGYYIEKPENLPHTRVMAKAVSIDMFLGQWWANQLDLGPIYPIDRTRSGLSRIFTTNRYTDTGTGYKPSFRDFLGTGDTGWQMFVHKGNIPGNSIQYYNEVMSGFEYSAAATMLQYGMIDQGMEIVKEISKRYDGRHRGHGEVHMASMSTVTGTGSPFGEDECGKFYARPLSSWSVLLALQGFLYDGPRQVIGFQPVWQPEDHASFFSAAKGWGLFTQNRKAATQQAVLDLKYGTLDVKTLVLAVPEGKQVSKVRVRRDGKTLRLASHQQNGTRVEIPLKQSVPLKAGSSLAIDLTLK
jgi:hypothetical protein